MREVIEGLYVGNENDVDEIALRELAIVHACKEPYHRQLLGYITKGAPKDHPEYLWAERDNRLFLNIVDAPKSFFFDKGMIDKALYFIHKKRSEGLKVLVHCNQGESRAPSIAILYLVKYKYIDVDTLEEAESEFLKLYPEYNPGEGIRSFVKENWDYYNTRF